MKRKTKIIVSTISVIVLLVAGAGIFLWQKIRSPLYIPGTLKSEVNISVPDQNKDAEYWEMGNGITLYHFSEGTGRNVLILHGGPGYPYSKPWSGLQPMTDRYQFHYYDQRGCGKSSRPVDSFSSRNYFKNVAQLYQSLGMGTQIADIERIRQILKEDKLILIGHSFGGLLAVLYASEFPGHVAGMVLVSPADVLVMPQDVDWVGDVRESLSENDKQAFDLFIDDYLDFPHIFSKTEDDLSSLRRQWATFVGLLDKPAGSEKGNSLTLETKPGGWMTFAIFFSTGLKHDYRQALGVVEAPALVLTGTQDVIEIDAIKQYADSLSNSQLKIINGAGHAMFEETPEEFSRIVETFLSQLE